MGLYNKGNVLKELGQEEDSLIAYKTFVDVTDRHKSSDAKSTANKVKKYLNQYKQR